MIGAIILSLIKLNDKAAGVDNAPAAIYLLRGDYLRLAAGTGRREIANTNIDSLTS